MARTLGGASPLKGYDSWQQKVSAKRLGWIGHGSNVLVDIATPARLLDGKSLYSYDACQPASVVLPFALGEPAQLAREYAPEGQGKIRKWLDLVRNELETVPTVVVPPEYMPDGLQITYQTKYRKKPYAVSRPMRRENAVSVVNSYVHDYLTHRWELEILEDGGETTEKLMDELDNWVKCFGKILFPNKFGNFT